MQNASSLKTHLVLFCCALIQRQRLHVRQHPAYALLLSSTPAARLLCRSCVFRRSCCRCLLPAGHSRRLPCRRLRTLQGLPLRNVGHKVPAGQGAGRAVAAGTADGHGRRRLVAQVPAAVRLALQGQRQSQQLGVHTRQDCSVASQRRKAAHGGHGVGIRLSCLNAERQLRQRLPGLGVPHLRQHAGHGDRVVGEALHAHAPDHRVGVNHRNRPLWPVHRLLAAAVAHSHRVIRLQRSRVGAHRP